MVTANKIRELEFATLQIRKKLLKLCTLQSIHIGGDLSIADVMTVLWQYKMKYDPKNIQDEYRDRFILSKGHASAVMSFNQAAIGCFTDDEIYKEYATDGGRFSMHSCNLVNPYVEVSTGSLGHGMPIACGIAAALKLKGNDISRVYTIMGDGEQSEGSIWEAAMNAVHYKLGNLVAIIDFNKLEADGNIFDITGIGNIAEKYNALGWFVKEINGNDVEEIVNALDNLPSPSTYMPIVLVCHTIKGKGVGFMENQAKWHAGKITFEQYELAIKSLDAQFYEKWGEYND
ncbi:MAG: transketolase [Phascolarctobacterium sp.]|uniref:transketolase n=1 Tax=Phascolarctobacterium sp. TaxID=2049039 RepID=UPI0026DD90F9|nr:transketolase [Phascolarctobacterium sp.]MDO4921598.1 transketolase [Phascolarctobacterium sp.]